MLDLWCEKYRPKTLESYVWVDPTMRATVENWLAQGALPHCLFSGIQGTGKTSLAKLLLRQLDVPDVDVMLINASRERQIDAFQDKIMNFVNAWALGPSGIKYILLDEADKMSQHAQGLLRNEMETHADSCRFIMTCNYPQKIIPAIHSRVQELRFPSLNREDFVLRLAEILDAEGVEIDEPVIYAYVNATYPDLRKCIGMAQQNSRDGKLVMFAEQQSLTQDYLLTMLDMFRRGQFLEARKAILSQIQPEQYEEFYRTLYQNLDLFGKTQEQQDEALLAIRRGLLNHAVIADPEINAAATLAELTQIAHPSPATPI